MRPFTRKDCGSLIAIFSLVFSLHSGKLSAQQKATRPLLVIKEPKVFDFGEVPEGSRVVHDFQIRNNGTSDLIFQRLYAACGCTSSKAIPETIPAGGDGILRVVFDTSGFGGRKSKEVRALTNDPDQETVIFALRGEVVEELKVDPPRVVFDLIPHGAGSLDKEVVITISKESENTLGAIKSFSNFIQVHEVSASPKLKRIKVSISPDAPVGDLRERVIVMVEGTAKKEISIPVYAPIVGEVTMTPPIVSFGLIEKNSNLERVVKVESHGHLPLKIEKIESTSPSLSFSYKEILPGKTYALRLVLSPVGLDTSKDYKELLTVVTNRGSFPLEVFGAFPPLGTR